MFTVFLLQFCYLRHYTVSFTIVNVLWCILLFTNNCFYHSEFVDTNEWLQPLSSGDKPSARGVHTATLVGDQFILYGGSSDFDEETMQCQEYYGDVHLIGKGKFVL